jgi:hypothetical protein
VGGSIPDAAPMTLLACQWSMSRQSQAEFRYFEYVCIPGSHTGIALSII